ncbi:MAG TPA: hypothetical protein VGL13_05495, partial [Polyangiaceae bacterium]
ATGTGCSLFISLDPINDGVDGGGVGGGMGNGGGGGSGMGGSPGCSGGKALCGSQCVDLLTDQANCGTCGTPCQGSNKCWNGQCCAQPAAGGTCNLPACGCATGSVCYPNTEDTGLACFASTGLNEGDLCDPVGICNSGFGCFGGICKKYCTTDTECALVDTARSCTQTVWPSNDDITGVLACQRICDPVHPQTPRAPLLACPSGFGCASSPDGASDCLKDATATTGMACTFESDCAIGYYCTGGNVCNKYCYTTADCTAGMSCMQFSPQEFAGSRPVGYCF